MRNMQRQNRRQIPKINTAILTAATIITGFLSFPASASAAESNILPVEVSDSDVVSVGMPVVNEDEKSPFDFILDPQGLLYETDAIRYGGGTVEEGATLLFHNSNGEYNFSSCSDRLTVTNQSTVPVKVTISAYVSNLEGVSLSESNYFSGNETPGIYLAIADDAGNIQPLSLNSEASLSWVMQEAAENTFDTYSFGLVGACNPNADWKDITLHPVVTVIWHVDPILPVQKETINEESKKDAAEDSDKELENLLKEMNAQEKSSENKTSVKDDATTGNVVNDSVNDTSGNIEDSVSDRTQENLTDKTTENAEDSADNTLGTAGTGNTAEESTDNTADKDRVSASDENTADDNS